MNHSTIRISIQLVYMCLYLLSAILLIKAIESNIHENMYILKISAVIGFILISNIIHEPIISKTYKLFNIKPNDRADTITAIRGSKKIVIFIVLLISVIISFVVFMLLKDNLVVSTIASLLSFVLSQGLLMLLIKESFEK